MSSSGEKTEQQVQKGTTDENIDFYSDMFSAKTLVEERDGGALACLKR